MNEAAIQMIKGAVLRALLKNPGDIEFYRAQADDPLRKPQYREALQQAIDQSRRMVKAGQQNGNQHSA